MALKLSQLKRTTYKKGETFYEKIGLPLLIARGKAVDDRPVSSCARAKRNGTTVQIVLFDTPIATMRQRGGMLLTTDGWRTKFTRNTLEQLLPECVRLDCGLGQWFMLSRHFSGGFRDGMVVMEDGHMEGGFTNADMKEQRKLLDKSRRYINRYLDELFDGKVAKPGTSDCFDCQFEAGNKAIKIGTIMPDGTTRDNTFEESGQHVRNHIHQGYFVPALLWNAIIEWGGIEQLNRVYTGSCMQYLWNQDGKEVNMGVTTSQFNIFKDVARRELKKVLTRYIKRRIGIEFKGLGWQSRKLGA